VDPTLSVRHGFRYCIGITDISEKEISTFGGNSQSIKGQDVPSFREKGRNNVTANEPGSASNKYVTICIHYIQLS
jgi:hypothetical protein